MPDAEHCPGCGRQTAAGVTHGGPILGLAVVDCSIHPGARHVHQAVCAACQAPIIATGPLFDARTCWHPRSAGDAWHCIEESI